MASLFVDIFKLNWMTFGIHKPAQRQHGVVLRQLTFQTIKNALVIVVTRHPAGRKRTVAPNAMATGFKFAESQNDMQMTFSPQDIAGREPEIFPSKAVQFRSRRKQ
ncbi:hypothetical protein D3C78_1093980 [compost metagenome]